MSTLDAHELHEQLMKRPFEIKASGDIVSTGNHPDLTNEMISKLKSNERFHVRIRIGDEKIWVLVIGRVDSHNANFDDSEEGQIFAGILNADFEILGLKFNDLVEFQSCDVYSNTLF